MKLETKDGWFKGGGGEERKTKEGGIGCITKQKKPSSVSVLLGQQEPASAREFTSLPKFPQPQLSGTPRVAPWHGEQLISYKSYVKKVNLNVSDAEAHSPLPHILAQLAFECKILPDRPPEHSNSFTSAKTPWVKMFRHARP